jgi:RNA polymerase sigma-70 factor (ECF subfamily)
MCSLAACDPRENPISLATSRPEHRYRPAGPLAAPVTSGALVRLMSRKRDHPDSSPGAFGDLYERYLDEIFRFVFYRILDQEEAEDLTERVFLKAWEALPRGRRPVANFRAWLYRVARNQVIDRHRTRKPAVPLEQAATLRDGSPAPEAIAQAREESAELAAVIARLGRRYQQVLVCRFVNGLSHAETAQVLGLKENHVRVLQHRALQELRGLLAEEP